VIFEIKKQHRQECLCHTMKPNLDSLKIEIEQYLEESGLGVFYGYSRMLESTSSVYWDCDKYPDYKQFIKAGRTAGAQVIVFHQREFAVEQVMDALQQLTDCDLERDESREFEKRLNDLLVYEGFICEIELSFDHQGRVFLFDLRTEWYEEFSGILDEIQMLSADVEDNDTPMSGYFSKN
jgi:hypothetical protein